MIENWSFVSYAVGAENAPYALIELSGESYCPFCKKPHGMKFPIDGMWVVNDHIKVSSGSFAMALGKINPEWAGNFMAADTTVKDVLDNIKQLLMINAQTEAFARGKPS